MTETVIDLATWPRAAQYKWFRNYERPHYATTSRLDVTHLVDRRRTDGVSFYRATLFAVAEGLHAVPETLMRFRSDQVIAHDEIAMSMPVPKPSGGFNYAYLPRRATFDAFDKEAAQIIVDTASKDDLNPTGGSQDAVAFLSCMPWLDYTSINNAMPHKHDCIPRVTWGKYVPDGDRWKMAMTLEVHHALVDGEHVGAFFNTVQATLDAI